MGELLIEEVELKQEFKNIPTKFCIGCKTEKAKSEFSTHKTNTDGFRTLCKKCTCTKTKEYYYKNKENYKVTRNECNNKCKICSVEFTDPIENRESCLCVDHDHTCCAFSKGSCGKCIRGFLCFSCNQGLGNFKDNKELLIKASKYLETACA